MAKPAPNAAAVRLAGLIADILPQLDETIAAIDVTGESSEIGVMLTSGERLRVTVETAPAE